ncbi:MAG: hypothetical protein ACI923_002849, partial [Flavobacteriales bacterium]
LIIHRYLGFGLVPYHHKSQDALKTLLLLLLIPLLFVNPAARQD